MKYPASHWRRIAELHHNGMTPEEIQNHYPNATLRTVKRWLRKCRDELGLIR